MGHQVLVLNQNYEPLNVCHTHRALVLMITGKAEIVLNGRGSIQTPSVRYPLPSVIRLSHPVRRPRPRLKLSRRAVFRRDSYTCQYCGLQSSHLTLDHVIPRHRGGSHTWENVVSACPSCNLRKGSKTLDEARMTLLHIPVQPNASVRAFFSHYLLEYDDWGPFITT